MIRICGSPSDLVEKEKEKEKEKERKTKRGAEDNRDRDM